MHKYWTAIYAAILAICLIVLAAGFKFGFVYQSPAWKMSTGVCAGFAVSAAMNLKKRLSAPK